eukprot:Skav224524  [mRNA]  locus=scaffold388:407530:409197:+ [translate_table: standard]
MVALTLKYSNLAKHQSSIFKHLHTFRKEGQLCDVVVKSRDGTEHKAHKAVLCAASVGLRNMLIGSFVEAHQVQQGQPVQIAASDTVVLALLEYIYGGKLQVELEDSLELLRLADAYSFPELAGMIEASLCDALEDASVATALKVLPHARDLDELSTKCEEKVVTNFEMCIELADFLELSPGQLGRILQRADLKVSREEVVVQGLFNWFKRSNDRGAFSALLHHIDFQSLSSSNLTQLQQLSGSIGPVGHDLQREVRQVLQARKKRRAANSSRAFKPKRRCLQRFWSPELGASSKAPQKVLPCADSMCWHNGAIYYCKRSSIMRWKPGDAESQVVAGRGARVHPANDLGRDCRVSMSPSGVLFVADWDNEKLLSFENGSGNVVLSEVHIVDVSCSRNGAIYLLTQEGEAVVNLVGATIQPVILSDDLPEALQFNAKGLFVTREDVIYVFDDERVLRIKPGEAEPVVVGEAPNKDSSDLTDLFVTEDEKIYVADAGQRKVWAFHPGDESWTEVLTCPENLRPVTILVEGRSLYTSMAGDAAGRGTYEYLMPLELRLG